MFEIPVGTQCEIIRPNNEGVIQFKWDETIDHVTKNRWLMAKEDICIDPRERLGPSKGNLIGFYMRGKDHDVNLGKWEGSVLICKYNDCIYLD